MWENTMKRCSLCSSEVAYYPYSINYPEYDWKDMKSISVRIEVLSFCSLACLKKQAKKMKIKDGHLQINT